MIRDVQVVDSLSSSLDRISRGLADMTPVMQQLGDYFVTSTKQRFNEGKSPEGVTWPAKSPFTLARYRKEGYRSRQPLIRTKNLFEQIAHEATNAEVAWGSNLDYAAMMNYGGTKAQWPHLWGNVPARKFLGVSRDDEVRALDILQSYIKDLAGQV